MVIKEPAGQESDVSNPPEHYIAKVNALSEVCALRGMERTSSVNVLFTTHILFYD